MADPNDTLDPEPVDAEFEPADDPGSGQSSQKSRGPGWISLILAFLLASAAGGGLGYTGVRYLAPPDNPETGDDSALAESISALQTRLAPLERAGPEAVDDTARTALDRLDARIEALEEAPSGLTDLSGLENRISALEAAPPAGGGEPAGLTAFEARIAALETAVSDVEALATQALDAAQAGGQAAIDPQILQNITRRLAELEDAGGAAADFEDPAPRIDELEAGVARLQSALEETRRLAETARSRADSAAETASARPDNAQVSRQLAARALALTALREVAMTGEGFEAERAALARLWRNNDDLEAVAGVARAGVPTLDQLEASYPGRAIRDAAGPGRMLFGLIEVRQTEGGDSDTGPLAITALAEDRLSEDDLAGAVALTERLEGEALEAARDWLIQARARQDLNTRLTRLRNALADDAAALGADPS
ncbi:hypothetical protein [Maricaulis sp.]|uniref:hypothetical protein n=1 Tax=Maricaulis sp. TaxID=1486257 RepID=UPI0026152810|nr:hypothetical protein [Maricaulis sp.]